MTFFTIGLTGCGDDPCSHEYGNWTTVTEATCTKSGTKSRTCKKCGHNDTASIPATGHNFVDGICTDCGATE